MSEDVRELEASPGEPDAEARLVEGRRLAERVDDLLAQGKQQQARSVVARGWQDAVPELPLRYPVVLARPSVRFASQLARYIRVGGDAPELKVELSGKQVIHGTITVSGRRLGELPDSEAAYLHSLGADAEVFTPRLTAIRVSATGESDKVEIELVRPELRRCSSCGRLHGEDTVNCADCRALRRPKDPDKVESEASPVALHEAMDAALADEPS